MKKIISLLFLIAFLLFTTVEKTVKYENMRDNVGIVLHQNNDMILSKKYDFNIIPKSQKISVIKNIDESLSGYVHAKYMIRNNDVTAITSHELTRIMLELCYEPFNYTLNNTLARSDSKTEMTHYIRGPCYIWNSS